MKPKQAFSRLLRELRQEKGISIKEIANKSGYSERQILKLEKGIHEPKLDGLYRIADALGVSPGQIIEAINNKLSG